MKRFIPPSAQELDAYAREIAYTGFDPNDFIDHYETVGWVVGRSRTPMVSWRAAVRTWQRRQRAWAATSPAGDRPNRVRVEAQRLAAWDSALRDCVLAIWPHHADRAEVSRLLRAAQDKFSDLGRNKAGRTVAEATLDVIRSRESTGWRGA
jgi:hypothetical protein